jgi:hypothetical protein
MNEARPVAAVRSMSGGFSEAYPGEQSDRTPITADLAVQINSIVFNVLS